MKEKIKVKGQLRAYMQWPLYLSAMLIIMNAIIGAVSVTAGIIMAVFTLLYIGIALWIYTYRKKRLLNGLVEFSAEYSWMQKQLLTDLELPYGIADESGRVLWGNTALAEVLGEEKPFKNTRKNLSSIFPEITKEVLDLEAVSYTHLKRLKGCEKMELISFHFFTAFSIFLLLKPKKGVDFYLRKRDL